MTKQINALLRFSVFSNTTKTTFNKHFHAWLPPRHMLGVTVLTLLLTWNRWGLDRPELIRTAGEFGKVLSSNVLMTSQDKALPDLAWIQTLSWKLNYCPPGAPSTLSDAVTLPLWATAWGCTLSFIHYLSYAGDNLVLSVYIPWCQLYLSHRHVKGGACTENHAWEDLQDLFSY